MLNGHREKWQSIEEGWVSQEILYMNGKGTKERTRVVCSTLDNRGKSFTPESRIEMLEERRALVERREDTQDASGFAIARDRNTPPADGSRVFTATQRDTIRYLEELIKLGIGHIRWSSPSQRLGIAR